MRTYVGEHHCPEWPSGVHDGGVLYATYQIPSITGLPNESCNLDLKACTTQSLDVMWKTTIPPSPAPFRPKKKTMSKFDKHFTDLLQHQYCC